HPSAGAQQRQETGRAKRQSGNQSNAAQCVAARTSPHGARRCVERSHGNAAAAGAGYHQSLHAARLHRDQPHRRRHLHHRCRCLHRRCRCLHHPHRRHRSPHSRHHPHLHRHPLRLLHRLHRRPHRPLYHPCPPCPWCCGASH
ncbi:unnamed protein product, partial [Closterium sp. NIES-53]